MNHLPPVRLPSLPFPPTSLVCPEIRFGRRLFYGQDALRGIWKDRFKGEDWSEGREEGEREREPGYYSFAVAFKAPSLFGPWLKWRGEEILKCNKVTARKVCSEQRWLKWWKHYKSEGKYHMHCCSIHSSLHCISMRKYISYYNTEHRKKAVCFRRQLNDGCYWREGWWQLKDNTLKKRLECLFIDLVPTSTRGVPLTWQIRQRTEGASSIARITGTAVWPPTILATTRHKRASVWVGSTLLSSVFWH